LWWWVEEKDPPSSFLSSRPMSPLLAQMEFCGRSFVYSNPKVQAFLRLNHRIMDKAAGPGRWVLTNQ